MKNSIISLVALIAAAFALSSCASTGKSTSETATACPECRSVLILPDEMQMAIDGYEDAPRYEHQCPGCQGALTTLFTDGELRHQCSYCKDSPYSCDAKRIRSMNREVSKTELNSDHGQ